MSDKPSYLGLLNAVSLGESRAHEYLEAWIAVTPNKDVKAVLANVSVREGEHGKAFAKRINELGYSLRQREDPDHAKRLGIAGSAECSDLEKMEKLGFGQLDTGDRPDIFDGFFKDHSIDIRTGELLGRYIAEERDSGRQLRCCYLELKQAASGGQTDAQPDRLARLEDQVADLCRTVETLCATVTAAASEAAAPRNGSKGRVAKAR